MDDLLLNGKTTISLICKGSSSESIKLKEKEEMEIIHEKIREFEYKNNVKLKIKSIEKTSTFGDFGKYTRELKLKLFLELEN